MKKVSIIVPVYNTEKYLPKCLDSLVNQTLNEIEILIINDGSPDNSQVIIDDYANRYPEKIRCIIKKNGGIGSVRNLGIKEVKGEYFAFLDSDDFIEPDAYEKLYNFAKGKNANLVSCDFIYDYLTKQKIFKEKRFNNINEAITNIHCVLWNRLYKTSFIQSLDFGFSNLKRYEDANYLYKMVTSLKENDFSHYDEALIHYVQREESWMHSYDERVLEALKMVDDVIEYYKKRCIFEKYKDELEYITIRNCFGQPYRTAVKIKDKEKRRKVLNQLFSYIYSHFPNWKKNKYLKKDSRFLYFTSINKYTFPIWSKILSLF